MKGTRHHVESLDVFRGATVTAMIVVNNPGDWSTVFPPLQHSNWNGCSVADVLFPFFIFIMGCALPFAFARRDATGPWRTSARITRRAVMLVVLGLVLNAIAALPLVASMRVPGVLQRLGVVYFVAALLVRSFGARTQALCAVGLLVAHWAAMTLVPWGGRGGGGLTQAQNLAGYIDVRVFGTHTLVAGFDPEGLLGTVPAVATALLGALAGQWMRRHAEPLRRIGGLAGGGMVAIAAGGAWSFVWPVNKPLWTGSYVLVTAGLAAGALAVCSYIVDVKGLRGWARPFVWLGVNPLAMYFCSEMCGRLLDQSSTAGRAIALSPKDWIYWHVFETAAGNVRGEWPSLAFAVSFAACWVGVSAVLYQRGIRIRV
jgi:predicted acyltransferase